MIVQESITHRLFGLSFGLLSSTEIRNLSVKEVTNSQSFDALKNPTYGGLYDRAFGPSDQEDSCATCGQNSQFCPGHIGHISLPLPVYNPILFRLLLQLLKRTCFNCHHLLVQQSKLILLSRQLRALDLGSLSLYDELQMIHNDLKFDHETDTAFADLLRDRLDKHIAVYRKINSEETVNLSKHIVDCRRLLIEELINGGGVLRVCPLCKIKSKAISAEHNSRIFFYSGRQKSSASAQAKKNTSMPTSTVADEDDDVEMEPESNVVSEKTVSVNELSGLQYMTQIQARDHLRKLWENEKDILISVLGALNITTCDEQSPIDIFFLDVLPVTPPRFRPVLRVKDKFYDNPMSGNLRKVAEDCFALRELLVCNKSKQFKDANFENSLAEGAEGDDSKVIEKLHVAWMKLQTHVNIVVDSDLDKITQDKNPGIKQLLEKKEGLFRRNMMGKRVNFAARSVISPDPYIATNEVGVPQIFAKKLTYPESVTPWNYHALKQAVINGPLVYPGAFAVINEDGTVTRLNPKSKTQREAVAKQLLTPNAVMGAVNLHATKRVCRHLINGDVLILNRQPTLHRPSMQAHKARVLEKEKTLRMHYSNCKAYNADFDGDEMNAHMPQNEAARSEAYVLACSDFQYLVPKDGTPLAGLIQDHMIGGVTLTIRGRFFDKNTYLQLVYNALSWYRGKIRLLPPIVLKPCVLWSGKQVLSTILINIIPLKKPLINLNGRAKINDRTWVTDRVHPCRAKGMLPKGIEMSETEVVIRQGELLVGVLDKGHYGPTQYGLVHCCYELYGGEMAGQLLTSLARVFTSFLQLRGFTLGVEDLLCTDYAEVKRRSFMETAEEGGREAATDVFNLLAEDAENMFLLRQLYQEAHFSPDGLKMKELDAAMKKVTDGIQDQVGKACMPHGLQKKFPANNLQLMVQSGAKGTSVNCMQMSCMLGQIELEGRRPQLMMSGQSLPSFLPYDCTPRAGGFVDGRFLTGIRPQEYFFHCMAGREGLVDTAVKTSRSGYLQRCLIKHLEGVMVQYDLTTRDSDGSVIQFRYGEDGLDILKTKLMKTSQFPFLINNHEAICKSRELKHLQRHIDFTTASQLWNEVYSWRQQHIHLTKTMRRSGFLHFCNKNLASFIDDCDWKKLNSDGRSEATAALINTWRNLSESKRKRYESKYAKKPDPVVNVLNPCRNFGAITEALDNAVQNYILTNPDQLLTEEGMERNKASPDDLRTAINLLNLKALASPGEAVGLIAAQSLGEPSTQMTLNTFHFAGRGEMNVTLGIPRLREILMVASAKIKTPTMEIPLTRDSSSRDKAKLLQEELNAVKLYSIVEDVEIKEFTKVKNRSNKYRLCTIRITFLSKIMSETGTLIKPRQLISFMEKRFLATLAAMIRKRYSEMEKSTLLSAARMRDRKTKERQTEDPETAVMNTDKGDKDDDISDDERQDDDATSRKNVDRQTQERDYEGEDEERIELGTDNEEDDEVQITKVEKAANEIEESNDENEEEVIKLTKKEKMEAEMRVQYVLRTIQDAVSYTFDPKRYRWCELAIQLPLSNKMLDIGSIVEAEIKKTEISQTKGISRCFLQESKVACGGEKALQLVTQGINLQEMHKYAEFLDLTKLYSNDIHAIANVYGIEAAYQVIIKEMRNVFAVYGIDVDYRHLSLVADYMTFEGKYKPFNRISMQSNVSPLQQMTFETTMSFLKTATVQGIRDDLKSPSARIVVGRVVGTGTGSFDLLQPLA